MDVRRVRAWRLLQRIAPLLFGKYHYEMEQIPVDGPFLLIANHACNMDPIFVGLASRDRPLAFVASEHLMRLGFVSKLLTQYLAIIPRPKASMAIETIKSVTKALKEGDPVVLFAEGDNTWNGVTGEIFPATGKLVRMLKFPLVTYRLDGNYLTKPRWAVKARRGRVKGSVVHVYSPEELSGMKPQQINDLINADIHSDSWKHQKESPVVFRGRKLAENLQKAIFICPECHAIDALFTKRDRIICRKCGHEVTIDSYGFLHGGRFVDLHAWDLWQLEAYRDWIQNPSAARSFSAHGVLTNLEQKSAIKVDFSLNLREKSIQINDGTILLSDISDMSMVKTERLLFTGPDGYYEFKSSQGILRPYVLAWRLIKETME